MDKVFHEAMVRIHDKQLLDFGLAVATASHWWFMRTITLLHGHVVGQVWSSDAELAFILLGKRSQ